MLQTSLAFFIVSVIAALLGFWWLAGIAATIAKIVFVLFLILFIFSLFSKTASKIDRSM